MHCPFCRNPDFSRVAIPCETDEGQAICRRRPPEGRWFTTVETAALAVETEASPNRSVGGEGGQRGASIRQGRQVDDDALNPLAQKVEDFQRRGLPEIPAMMSGWPSRDHCGSWTRSLYLNARCTGRFPQRRTSSVRSRRPGYRRLTRRPERCRPEGYVPGPVSWGGATPSSTTRPATRPSPPGSIWSRCVIPGPE